MFLKPSPRALAALAISAAAAAAFAVAADAQTFPTVSGPGGVGVAPSPVAATGLDSVSGKACVVGASATCLLPVSGGGGGGSAPAATVGASAPAIRSPMSYRDQASGNEDPALGSAYGQAVQNVSGLGALALAPAASTNGTSLGILPSGAVGARFYLSASDSVTFTVAASQPSIPPTVTFTISGGSSGTGPNWDENLSGGQMIYVTATTGAPKFRWY